MHYDKNINDRVLAMRTADDLEHTEGDLDLLQYWSIVYREKWGILGLIFAASIATAVFVFDMENVYRSTATLLIENQTANVVSIQEIYGVDQSREYLQTQFEILNSRQLAEDVIRKLDLAKGLADQAVSQKSEWSVRSWIPFLSPIPPLTEEQRWQRFVSGFKQKVSIDPVRGTALVKISYESTDPELTYKVANELGNSYIEGQLDARVQLTQKASSWLTTRLETMRKDLEQSEKKLQAYREREGLVDVSGVKTLTVNEINEISTQLVSAKQKTAEARVQMEAVGATRMQYDPRWESLPGVLAHPLAQQAKAREAEAARTVSELSQHYGPKHPKLIVARANLDNVVFNYRNQVTQVVEGFARLYEQALADQQALEKSLESSKNQIQSISRKNYELSQLEREAETSRELYNLFFTRFRETREAGFEAANARFVDRAERPYTHYKPERQRLVFMAALFAALFGIGLAFLRHYLDNTIRTSNEVEEKLHQPVVGVLPMMKDMMKTKGKAALAYLDSERATFSEAVRTIRTGVILSGVDKPLKRIIVTSSIPGEGKTTLSLNIAFSFGQMERVLLIDADMRRPSVATHCGLPKGLPGLSEIIAGTEDVKDCIHHFSKGGIDIIPAGIIPPNPLELLSSKRFAKLIEQLGERYDRVFIDSAPTQAVSDSLVLSDLCDGVIYVVKADSTTTHVANLGLERLRRVNAHITGVVLNQFDSSSANRYRYYGRGYYDYYGYGISKSYTATEPAIRTSSG